MQLSSFALVMLGLLLSAWSVGAAWIALGAHGRARQARGARGNVRRLTRMIDTAPALPLLVRSDGRIEGPERLAALLGHDALPAYLTELDRGPAGLTSADVETLAEEVRRTQRSAAPFATVVPTRSGRSLAVRGQLADPAIAPASTALLWFFDMSDSHAELAAARSQAAQTSADFAALAGLVEHAPLPMWVRGTDGSLRFANQPYVSAVGAVDVDDVLTRNLELVEPVDGMTPRAAAARALEKGAPLTRRVQATIAGERRALRVTDLPVPDTGQVAGYAIDVEEREALARELAAFRAAQRALLDHLPLAVAQFSADRRLDFVNEPFVRIFALPPDAAEGLAFDRLLDRLRDGGRLPESRDFPAFRRELASWFQADAPVRADWTVKGGMHLRVLGVPLPDGGLVLVAEDRSDQLAVLATRDTLLRVRTAMVDNLFEAVAVVAPDGRLQLWNRRFGLLWDLPEDLLHEEAGSAPPRFEAVLQAIATRLARPAQSAAIGDVVRAATLDRRMRAGQVLLADGRTLAFAGVPLPDGNGMLTTLDITGQKLREDVLRERADLVERADQALQQAAVPVVPGARETVDLLPFVTAAVRAQEAAISAGNLMLDLRGDRGAGEVQADPAQLGEALQILLGRAIADCRPGGRIQVTLAGPRKPERIVLAHDGIAIAPTVLEEALGSAPPRSEAGRVLARARTLVEAQDGKLRLRSDGVRGTIAAITLP
ncbi:PAS-domain containing protein [Croceibacterium sp. TMG7-5b_MA50]|uniref:PAS-domain containing protein n=1 Tax=Croceibacterium sp. TMG7-5b_MA50 TaxID=3121290 RepID=UPI0032216B82